MRRHDRPGTGKHKYYTNFHVLESDIGIEEPTQLVEAIGQRHLLVQSVTTGAVEMMKNDGSDRRAAVIVELEGRFNRTENTGTQKAVLTVDAAVMLYKNLEHSLGVLMDNGMLKAGDDE